MRELDYKVYNEYSGRMERVTGIGLNNAGKINRIETGFTQYIISNDRDKFHLREYIGMKDKNHKKIYEGDIIKWREAIKGVVVWLSDYNQLGHFLRTQDSVLDVLNTNGNYALEVVGNIYENPELISQ